MAEDKESGEVVQGDEQVVESRDEGSGKDPVSSSSQDLSSKVFISEEELRALEEKIKSAPEDKKSVYEEVASELKTELEKARKELLSKQEQEALKAEVQKLKEELSQVKEQAFTPSRKGVVHTPQSIFKTDNEGRKGIPVDELERLTREVLFKK